MSQELKPCPFCGENAWIQKIYQILPEGGLSKVPQFFIQCKEGGCESMTGLCGMEETAIEVWNKRESVTPEGMELVNSSHYRKLLEVNGERFAILQELYEDIGDYFHCVIGIGNSEDSNRSLGIAEARIKQIILDKVEALAPKEPKP